MRHLGFTAPGFEPVAETFGRNFTERGEVGAAFAAMHDGEMVVDLWGGLADSAVGRPWRQDTIQVIMSGTKGLVAVCLLLLVERGELELDAPVAHYWPEFGAQGKGSIRVWQLAAHRARLPAIRTPLSEQDLNDPERLAALLAAQAPEQDPRTELMYHGLTYGWLCGELVRRVTGRTVGSFFAQEVAEPLDLDLWIGLPAEQEPRVATLEYSPDWLLARAEERTTYADDDLWKWAASNPDVFPRDDVLFNTRAYHATEMPGINGIGTARSIARLYGCLARGGTADGVRLLSPATVELGRTLLASGDEYYSGRRAYGVGFMLQTEEQTYGPPVEAFGHPGAGGSVHGAWPAERIGFSYSMNQMRGGRPVDARSQLLLAELYRSLATTRLNAKLPTATRTA